MLSNRLENIIVGLQAKLIRTRRPLCISFIYYCPHSEQKVTYFLVLKKSCGFLDLWFTRRTETSHFSKDEEVFGLLLFKLVAEQVFTHC